MKSWIEFHNGYTLPWMDEAIVEYGFGKWMDCGIADSVQRVVIACLSSASADELISGTGPMRTLLHGYKDRQADSFAALVASYKGVADDKTKKSLLSRALAMGMGARAHVLIRDEHVNRLQELFSAYFEFEHEKLQVASRRSSPTTH